MTAQFTRNDLQGCSEHLKHIAIRMNQGEDALVASIAKFGEIAEHQARKVFEFYRKNKMAKRARGTTYDWHVTHGAFLDRDTIRRALEQA